MKLRVLIFMLILMPVLGLRADVGDGMDFKLVREEFGVQEYELLSNGLRVLLLEDHSFPVLSVNVTYQVGSRNEVEGKTGTAHFLEHMMFKGSGNYNRESETPIAPMFEQIGAEINAVTSMDYTNYYEVLPSEWVHLALDIEADRMRGALLRDKDIQFEKNVVLNELQHRENSPMVKLYQKLWNEAYQKHPYRRPVIGLEEDIKNMSEQDFRDFYNQYYWPNNAVLTLVGDFDSKSVLKLIGEKFGSLERASFEIPSVLEKEPEQTELRRFELKTEDQVNVVMIGVQSVSGTDPQYIPLDVLSRVLTGGKTSRLYSLVEEGLAVEVMSMPPDTKDKGLFLIYVVLSSEADHRVVEDRILSVLDEMKLKGVSEEELTRAVKQIEVDTYFAQDGAVQVASELVKSIAVGDWSLFHRYVPQLKEVTTKQILNKLNTFFQKEKMTIGYLLSQSDAGQGTGAVSLSDLKNVQEPPRVGEPEIFNQVLNSKSEVNTNFASRVKSSEVSGAKVMSFKTQNDNIVQIVGSFQGAGSVFTDNPLLSYLTASMLDKGTQNKSKIEIAEILGDRGAEIAFSTDYKRVSFDASCLREDLDLVVSMISEQLREPLFDSKEFERVKQHTEVLIKHQMTNTGSLGYSELSRIVYDPAHPGYDLPFEEQINILNKTTLDDVKTFFEKQYSPTQFLFVTVGDVEHGASVSAFEKHFGSWEDKNMISNFDSSVQLKDKSRKYIPVKGKRNLDVFFAHVMPLNRMSPDYIPLSFSNFVLGGNFSSRLSTKVRHERGLTYSISSNVAGVTNDLEGVWLIRMISFPEILEQGIEETMKEVGRFREEGISDIEMKQRKNTIVGRFKTSLSTTHDIANSIIRMEELELGIDYLDQYPQLIKDLNLEEVNRVIQKYYHPDKINIVVAGDKEIEK